MYYSGKERSFFKTYHILVLTNIGETKAQQTKKSKQEKRNPCTVYVGGGREERKKQEEGRRKKNEEGDKKFLQKKLIFRGIAEGKKTLSFL